MLLPLLGLVAKGGALAVGYVGGRKLMSKGEEMVEEAGGLGGVGDAFSDVVGNLDILDIFGTKKAKHDAEQAQAEAQRNADIKATKQREKELKAQQKAEAKRLKAEQDAQLKALRQQTSRDRAHFEQQLKELEERHRRELQAASSRTDKAIAATRLKNVLALKQASMAVQQPSATQQLRELVSLAKDMMSRDGVAPESGLFQAHGVDTATPDLDSLLEDSAGMNGATSSSSSSYAQPWTW